MTRIETPIEPARWRRYPIAEGVANVCSSAPCYRRSEDVGILAVVKAERKLIQVQGKVFPADIVIGADHATLEQAPERFDVVGVDIGPVHRRHRGDGRSRGRTVFRVCHRPDARRSPASLRWAIRFDE